MRNQYLHPKYTQLYIIGQKADKMKGDKPELVSLLLSKVVIMLK